MRTWIVCTCITLLLTGCALPSGSVAPPSVGPEVSSAGPASLAPPLSSESAGHVALWYIPNRISDLLDIVRARLRLGPGLAIDARFTESLVFHHGGYSSVFVGIPGPRRERVFNWPVGIESMTGGDIALLDGTAWSGDAPHYGQLEVGLGAQLLIVGADLGLDVYELLDFVTGIVTVDLIGDDI